MNSMDCHTGVAELQGLYGPLRILEGNVQQVWALRQLRGGEWRTGSGKRLRIRHPGRWNRGAGPDFREAVLELDGEVRVGDVEIHLYREDWWRHGHQLDPAYDQVLLHVVLFAGGMRRAVHTAGGRTPEEWTMGPWMREDLEAVAGGEPGLFGELTPELREWMEAEDPESVRERLRIGADRRWQDKEGMARCLLEAHGWDGALHRMVLFHLGFPFNRRPFFAMAESFPAAAWRDEGLLEVLREGWRDRVKWTAGRPANRAGTRLRQYLQLSRSAAHWMQRLGSPPAALTGLLDAENQGGGPLAGTRDVRSRWCFRQWRDWLQQSVFKGQLSDSLGNRLWIDVLLPALAAAGRLPRDPCAVLWFHARPGQYPDGYRPLLRLGGIHTADGRPLCNGWIQGMLWADDQLRLERIRLSSGVEPPAAAPAAGFPSGA
jgi:hypothetical protein